MSKRHHKGIDSGLGMLADMVASGLIDEAERKRLAFQHLAKVYDLTPPVYDFPCLTCHDHNQRTSAVIERQIAELQRDLAGVRDDAVKNVFRSAINQLVILKASLVDGGLATD
jgi:hypothetical protein